MVLLETAAVVNGLKGLFMYNRDNYMWNRKMQQLKLYHTQKMRISQVRLFREDIHDLFQLTIRKMDHYLIINVLMLLFAGGFFYEGRVPPGSPAWLLWVWTMAIGSTLVFLTLSVWLAIHASITAQTFAVRLLTQWLRLPIPGLRPIHAAAVSAAKFEKTRGQDMLRIPIVSQIDGVKSLADSIMSEPPAAKDEPFTMGNEYLRDEMEDNYTLFVEHFHLFHDLQKQWQGYDAYSRVCMVVGTNTFISAIAYMSLAYFVLQFKQWGGLACLVILQTFSYFHARMNIRLTPNEGLLAGILVTSPTALSAIAAGQTSVTGSLELAKYFSPFIYLLSMAWMAMLLYLGSDVEGGMPTRFITVQSIDVLGLDPVRPGREDDEPVAMTVPQAPVLQRGDALRKTKVSLARAAASVNSPVPMAVAPQSSMENIQDLLSDDSFSEGSGDDRDDEAVRQRYFKASMRTQLLPWHSFNQVGAVIISLWLFSFIYSILVLTGVTWGWPQTTPIT